MGTILITDATGPHAIPLSASTLIGRHFLCCHPIADPTIHLYWLEIRWASDIWLWRILAGEERTRGPGSIRDGIWRELSSANGRGSRIVWDDRCTVELVENSPPQLCGRLAHNGEWVTGPDIEQAITKAQNDEWLDVSTQQHIADGQFVNINGKSVQIYLPRPHQSTDKFLLSLTNPDLRIDIDLKALSATFTVARNEAKIIGECVRVLAVYVSHRLENPHEDLGWLSRPNAHRDWVSLGGNAGSPEARIAWERGKLRTQLARQKVCELTGLFEIRNLHGERVSRIAVEAKRLSLRR